jgi:hypothetical protein
MITGSAASAAGGSRLGAPGIGCAVGRAIRSAVNGVGPPKRSTLEGGAGRGLGRGVGAAAAAFCTKDTWDTSAARSRSRGDSARWVGVVDLSRLGCARRSACAWQITVLPNAERRKRGRQKFSLTGVTIEPQRRLNHIFTGA